MAQDELGIPRGSIRATVLIETIPAAFEMDEILYELREHSAGLNCGRWDYIFSIIKKFCKDPAFTMPDRAQVTMTAHCMHSYSLLAIKTCHRRGIHAIGGMAAQIPIKNDPAGQRRRPWKKSGPTRSARPATATTARGSPTPAWCRSPRLSFDARMPQPNQIDRRRDDVQVTADDLLTVPAGRDHRARAVPEHRRGHPIHGRLAGGQRLRADLQPHGGRRHGGNLPRPDLAMGPPAQRRPLRRPEDHARPGPPAVPGADGQTASRSLGRRPFARGNFDLARKLIEGIVLKDEFTEFMTLVGYEHSWTEIEQAGMPLTMLEGASHAMQIAMIRAIGTSRGRAGRTLGGRASGPTRPRTWWACGER